MSKKKAVKKTVSRSTKPRFGAKLQDKATGLVGTLRGIYTTSTRGPRYELAYMDAVGKPQSHWVDAESTKAAK